MARTTDHHAVPVRANNQIEGQARDQINSYYPCHESHRRARYRYGRGAARPRWAGAQPAGCSFCEGKIYTADVATKSLRKVKATIAANGAENTFVMIQGKLKNDEIAECGIVAQVKA
jgi:hypothetical protein